MEGLGNKVAPLYFRVKPIRAVSATNEQCDFAFSYDDGHFELKNAVPNGFPEPGNSSRPHSVTILPILMRVEEYRY